MKTRTGKKLLSLLLCAAMVLSTPAGVLPTFAAEESVNYQATIEIKDAITGDPITFDKFTGDGQNCELQVDTHIGEPPDNWTHTYSGEKKDSSTYPDGCFEQRITVDDVTAVEGDMYAQVLITSSGIGYQSSYVSPPVKVVNGYAKLDVMLMPDAEIDVQVNNSETVAAVEGAKISFTPKDSTQATPYSAVSEGGGDATLTVRSGVGYNMKVSCDGFEVQELEHPPFDAGSENEVVQVRLKPVKTGMDVSGVVYFENTLTPVVGAKVAFVTESGTPATYGATTDEYGAYTVNVPFGVNGSWKVSCDGYRTIKGETTVYTKDSPATVDYTMLWNDNAVAKIGDADKTKRYETLSAAVQAAEDNDTVIVLSDFESDSMPIVGLRKNITVDLCGHTVISSDFTGFAGVCNGSLTVKNGTVIMSDGVTAFWIAGGMKQNEDTDYSTLNIENLTLDSTHTPSAILVSGVKAVNREYALKPDDKHGFGVKVAVKNSTLNVNNGIVISEEVVYSGAREAEEPTFVLNNPAITVEGSTITALDSGVALLSEGYADFTVTSSTISGGNGIRAGLSTFDVKNSTVTGTGADVTYDPEKDTATGDAILVLANSSSDKVKMTLNGVTADSEYGNAIEIGGKASDVKAEVNISRGSYKAAEGKRVLELNSLAAMSSDVEIKLPEEEEDAPAGILPPQFTEFAITLDDGISYIEDNQQVLNTTEPSSINVVFPVSAVGEKPVIHYTATAGMLFLTDGWDLIPVYDGGTLDVALKEDGDDIKLVLACGNVRKSFSAYYRMTGEAYVDYKLSLRPVPDPYLVIPNAENEFYVVAKSDSKLPIGAAEFTLKLGKDLGNEFGKDIRPVNYAEYGETKYFQPAPGFSLSACNYNEAYNCMQISVVSDDSNVFNYVSSSGSPDDVGVVIGTVKLTLPEIIDYTYGFYDIEFVNLVNVEHEEALNENERYLNIRKPNVLPVGYDENKGEITVADFKAYSNKFYYDHCQVQVGEEMKCERTLWLAPGAVFETYLTPPIPDRGYSIAHSDTGYEGKQCDCEWGHNPPFESYAESKSYNFTAHHNRYPVINPPMIEKIIRVGLNGDEQEAGWHYFEDSVRVYMKKPDESEQKVFRKDSVGYKKVNEEGFYQTELKEQEGGQYYLEITDWIDDGIEILCNPVEYVKVTFKGIENVVDVPECMAFTLKGAPDKLYGSLDEFILGESRFMVPEQSPCSGFRLDPPEAKLDASKQQWYGTNGVDFIPCTTGQLNTSPCTVEFKKNIEMYPAGSCEVWKVHFAVADGGQFVKGAPADVYVDRETAVNDILNGIAHDYTTGSSFGSGESLIILPDVEAINTSYRFKEWTVSEGSVTDGLVTGDVTLTATFEVNYFNLSIAGKAVLKNVHGDINGQISCNQDLTFELKLDEDTRLEKVSYVTDDDDPVEITAADGVYTVPKEAITGDLTIVVETVDTVTVYVKGSAHGIVKGQTAFVFDVGTYWSDAISMIEINDTLPDYGYECSTGLYADEACTALAGSIGDQKIMKSATVYVKFTAKSFELEWEREKEDQGNYFTLVNGLDGNKVIYGTDVVLKWNKENSPLTKLSFSVDGGVQNITLKPDSEGLVVIPGKFIIGDVSVSFKTLADELDREGSEAEFTVNFVSRVDYGANVYDTLGMKVLQLVDEDGIQACTNKSVRLANGTTMFWSSKYHSFVCWVDENLTGDDLNGFFTVEYNSPSHEIDYSGDVNMSGSVTVDDAGITNDALFGRRIGATSAEMLFRMDVCDAGSCVNANDVTWMLMKACGLIGESHD